MSKYEKYLAEANAMIAAGFATKAAQKAATEKLNRAYEAVRDSIIFANGDGSSAGLAFQNRDGLLSAKDYEAVIYDALPFDLHQFRENKPGVSVIAERKPDQLELIRNLAALREAAKGMPIVPAVSKKDPLTLRAEELETEFTAKAQADKTYDPSKDLEKQVRLPVGAIQHYATSIKGNTFLRWKYYLSGRVTALRTILGVAEMKQLELDGKTEQAAVYRAAFEKSDPWAVHVADRASSPVTQAVRAVSEADTIEGVIDSMTRGSKP